MQNKYLICTDLDRTLIPNGPASESAVAERLFAAFVARPDVTLVYVSGRHRALVEEAMAEYRLPVPDFVLGDVGTTIYRVGPERTWQRYEPWESAIAEDWCGLGHSELENMLSDLSGLRLQERSRQNRFKLSYYVNADEDNAALINAVSSRLESTGVHARLVSSRDDISGLGLLDVLPARASKRHAIEALMELEGLTLQQTVFCGDSGNDLEVLGSPIPAVLVANARPEIKQQAAMLAEQSNDSDQLYIADGDFLGMNGNYRGGMLEGIAHYHSSIRAWLTSSVEKTTGATS